MGYITLPALTNFMLQHVRFPCAGAGKLMTKACALQVKQREEEQTFQKLSKEIQQLKRQNAVLAAERDAIASQKGSVRHLQNHASGPSRQLRSPPRIFVGSKLLLPISPSDTLEVCNGIEHISLRHLCMNVCARASPTYCWRLTLLARQYPMHRSWCSVPVANCHPVKSQAGDPLSVQISRCKLEPVLATPCLNRICCSACSALPPTQPYTALHHCAIFIFKQERPFPLSVVQLCSLHP